MFSQWDCHTEQHGQRRKHTGEVSSPFGNLLGQKMRPQFQFFPVYTPKKGHFVKKRPIENGVVHIKNCKKEAENCQPVPRTSNSFSMSVYSCPHANVCTLDGLKHQDAVGVLERLINLSLSPKQVSPNVSQVSFMRPKKPQGKEERMRCGLEKDG